MLDRHGRSDEAIGLLRSLHRVGHLAALLRKAGRESELRELVAGEGREIAAHFLAALLEEQGRATEAVDVLRTFADDRNVASDLAVLLRRHGRVDEAVEVFYTAVRREGAHHGCRGVPRRR